MAFNFSDGLICRQMPNLIEIRLAFSNNNDGYFDRRFDSNKACSGPKHDQAVTTQIGVRKKENS